MEKIISYGKQTIEQDDIDAVVEVMKGDWLTQGPKIEEFEQALADYCGAKYAIVTSSGTAALHIACRVTDCFAYKGITSPITFVASANAFEYNKIETNFVDIDKNSWNIDVEKIEEKIDVRTKILIPVHFAGLPCNLDYIKWLKDKYNLIVIEDAAHALGAEYNGEKIGSCKYSDMTVFSFHPVKLITTLGEGGAILTNNEKYADRARQVRSHGITKSNMIYSNDPWYYEMQELGVNARMTDAQCACGISQLKKLDRFIDRRNEIASIYKEKLRNTVGLKIQRWNYDIKHAYHLFVVHFDYRMYDRRKIYENLKKKNIYCQIHYIPVHLQPYYRNKYNFQYKFYPVSENYYAGCLSLPIYPMLTNEDLDYVIQTFREIIHECRH